MSYSLTRATSWNLAGYIYLIIASLVSTPILISSLGLSEFARYALILSTLALASAIDLGMPQSVVRALVKTRNNFEQRIKIWGSSSVIFIASGTLAAFASLILRNFIHVELLEQILIFGLIIMANLVAHYTTLPQAEGHFGYYNVKTFIVGTANTLLAALLASSGHNITILLVAQLFSYFITLLFLAYFSLKFFPRPMDAVLHIPTAKSLLKFGLKNQIGKIVNQIQSQYAKFILVFISPLSLSALAISQGVVQKLAGGVSQLASALYPRASGGGVARLYNKLQLSLLTLGILSNILFHLYGEVFIIWWLKDPILSNMVHQILQVLIYYFAILILTPLPSTILDSHGYPGTTSLFAFLTTFLEISLTLLLLSNYRVMAPVYGSLLALTLTTPILLYVTHRVLKSST